MNRRDFLATTSAGVSATLASSTSTAAPLPFPVIDTHIHLFDISRPGGVPWPPKDNAALYKTALPDRYRKLAMPHGVVGAIEVECSPLVEDNQWVLDVMAKDTIMVGTIGDLEPGKPDFKKQLERFQKNKLFLGIRYGNLWGRDIHDELPKPAFVEDLKLLAQAGMTLDTANPTPRLIEDMVRVTQKVPNLRVVIDHLPKLDPPADEAGKKKYLANLAELGKNKNVWVKVSSVFRNMDGGRIPRDLTVYKPVLDQLYGIFGPDHVIYGSDWPNSDNWVPYDEVFRIVKEYFLPKGNAVAEKYFWKNSVAAYKWVKRDKSQPGA